jgi:6-phosphofructokinase 1
MKRIAVLTSGGDAPGMNAAIRAVARCGIERGWKVSGVHHGYAGLISGDFMELDARAVSGILQQGGTMLGSARCPRFHTAEGQREAIDRLERSAIEALVVIGGNGSQTGARELHRLGFPVVGVASTIDNDLYGSDITIGVDTALNIALEAIDRLKTTASSHHRAFLIETMGRDCGYLALMAGIAGGAEIVVTPEQDTTAEQVAEALRHAWELGKAHAIAVVAEGARMNAEAMAAWFKTNGASLGFDLRTTVLGHVQRGGAPLAFDRLLATRLGHGAVRAIEDGAHGVLVGWIGGAVARTPYEEVVGHKKTLDPALFRLASELEI